MKTRFFLAGSAIALGAGLTLGVTPAAAQEVCDVNGGSPSGSATNPEDLACGTGSTANGGGIFAGATAIGAYSHANGSDSISMCGDSFASGNNTAALG